MCVAVLVETALSLEDLRLMEQDNPHGAGLAWAKGDSLRYLKGTDLTAEQIFELLKSLPRPVLLHFRWATHGPRVPHLAHPFPLGVDALKRRTSGEASALMIHNGVWSAYERFIPRGIPKDAYSDTAIAAYAAGLTGEHVLDDVSWSTAVGRAAGSGRMDVTLRGTWIEREGNQFSNLKWQTPWTFQGSGTGTGYTYGWDEDGRFTVRSTRTIQDRQASEWESWLAEYDAANAASAALIEEERKRKEAERKRELDWYRARRAAEREGKKTF